MSLKQFIQNLHLVLFSDLVTCPPDAERLAVTRLPHLQLNYCEDCFFCGLLKKWSCVNLISIPIFPEGVVAPKS